MITLWCCKLTLHTFSKIRHGLTQHASHFYSALNLGCSTAWTMELSYLCANQRCRGGLLRLCGAAPVEGIIQWKFLFSFASCSLTSTSHHADPNSLFLFLVSNMLISVRVPLPHPFSCPFPIGKCAVWATAHLNTVLYCVALPRVLLIPMAQVRPIGGMLFNATPVRRYPMIVRRSCQSSLLLALVPP